MRKLIKLCLISVSLSSLLILTSQTQAAKIKSVNGKNVTIDLQNDSYKVGDILKISNKNGKTVGITKIKKINGRSAEGLLKGKAESGFSATLRSSKTKQKKIARSSESFFEWPSTYFIGALFGYNSVSIDAKLPTSGTTSSLSGNGMSLKGLIDLALFPNLPTLSVRGLAGFDQLQTDGSSNTECGGTCELKITYLTAGIWGRYLFQFSKSFTPWGGAGFDILIPLSKSTSVISESSISTTYLFSIGGGLDWTLSDSSYLPFQFEYNFYPSTDSVKTSSFTFRGGYAKSF